MSHVVEIALGLVAGIALIGGALFFAFRNEFRAKPRPARLPGQTDSVDRGTGADGVPD